MKIQLVDPLLQLSEGNGNESEVKKCEKIDTNTNV